MTHPVVERLRARDPAERRAACLAAGEDPSAILLVDALADALGDPDRGVARAASDALVRIARGGGGGVEAVLHRALRGEVPSQRWHAAFCWARLQPPSARILPALVEALASPDGDVRWEAARMLTDAGRVIGEVFPMLMGLAGSADDPVVRRMAVHCLGELGPERPETIRALLDASRCDEPVLRRAALTAMGKLHEPHPDLFDRLVEVAGEPSDSSAQSTAIFALASLGERFGLPDPARERLEQLASTTDPSPVSSAARRALEQSRR